MGFRRRTRSADNTVSHRKAMSVCLVYLVDLVSLVSLVSLVDLLSIPAFGFLRPTE
jgi:hypothetical protein